LERAATGRFVGRKIKGVKSRAGIEHGHTEEILIEENSQQLVAWVWHLRKIRMLFGNRVVTWFGELPRSSAPPVSLDFDLQQRERV